MPATLTPQHLLIPRVVARGYARRHRALRPLCEEMESVAALALARAARDWDESRSPGGAGGLGGFLVSRARFGVGQWLRDRLAKKRSFQERFVSLDAPADGAPVALEGALAAPDRRADLLEARDLIDWLTRGLTPRQREVLWLLARGQSCPEVAARHGCTPSAVSKCRLLALEKCRARLALLGEEASWRD